MQNKILNYPNLLLLEFNSFNYNGSSFILKNFHYGSSIHIYFCFQTYSKYTKQSAKNSHIFHIVCLNFKKNGKFSSFVHWVKHTRRHSALKLLCLFHSCQVQKDVNWTFMLLYSLWINKNVTSALMCTFTKEWILFWHRWIFLSLLHFPSCSLFLYNYFFRDLPSLKKNFFLLPLP